VVKFPNPNLDRLLDITLSWGIDSLGTSLPLYRLQPRATDGPRPCHRSPLMTATLDHGKHGVEGGATVHERLFDSFVRQAARG
jgi:hypothetical protein